VTCEVTAKILCDKETAFEIVKSGGFRLLKTFTQVSSYWTHLPADKPIRYKKLLDNSVLVRDSTYKDNTKEAQLVYKDKACDENENVVAEKKTICAIENAEVANNIFKVAGFRNWVTTDVEFYIFVKGRLGFCIKDVDDLGLYIEVEQRGDTIGKTIGELTEIAKTLNLPLGDDFGAKIPYLLYMKQRHSHKVQ